MKNKSALWLLVGVLLIIVPLLVACGGEAPAPAPAPAPTAPAPAPAPASTPAPEPAPTAPAPAPAPAPTPAPEPAPAGGLSVIPHTLEGRDDCLMCHGETGLQPFPADHAGRTNDTCTACHKSA